MMNKQQYFGAFDRDLMSAGFFLEDELYARLHSLAKLTCNVVKDEDDDEDGDQDLRRNPQRSQLESFCMMVDGNLDSYDDDISMVEFDDMEDLDDE